jgi:hypothetical protein
MMGKQWIRRKGPVAPVSTHNTRMSRRMWRGPPRLTAAPRPSIASAGPMQGAFGGGALPYSPSRRSLPNPGSGYEAWRRPLLSQRPGAAILRAIPPLGVLLIAVVWHAGQGRRAVSGTRPG